MSEGFNENHCGKRIRWSRSGSSKIDARLDTLASLWIEGALTNEELATEITEVMNDPVVQTPHDAFGIAESIAACSLCVLLHSSLALCQVLEYDSEENRRTVLNSLSHRIGLTTEGSSADKASCSWVGEVFTSSTGSAPADNVFDKAFSRWRKGTYSMRECLSVVQTKPYRLIEYHHNRMNSDLEARYEGEIRAAVKEFVLHFVARRCEELMIPVSERAKESNEVLSCLGIDNPRTHRTR